MLVFWERQQSACCGTHAVNNLLQGPYFDESQMSQFAQELDAAEKEWMMSQGTDTKEVLFAANS
jgi:hypothetical protein